MWHSGGRLQQQRFTVQITTIRNADNTNLFHWEKYHCSTANLLFDWFGFDQTSKSVRSLNISEVAKTKQIKHK